jgi:hypothetical protein
MQTMAHAAPAKTSIHSKAYLPREHGATAMLLTPILGVAVLARNWHWSELAVAMAALAAISAKEPAVLLMRQKFIWKRRSPEWSGALRWLFGWSVLLIASVFVLLETWPFKSFLTMGAGIAGFAFLAIAVNLKNRQRSTLFQIVSATALTSTSVATCIAASGKVTSWCWWFWALSAMQASAGILVVHARLDARIALRKSAPVSRQLRLAAQAAVGVLLSASAAAVLTRHGWIAAALALAALGYVYDLMRQRDAVCLQMPLKTVGLQALMLSSVYAALVMADLW